MQYILKSKLAKYVFSYRGQFTVMVTPGGFSKPINMGRLPEKPVKALYAIKVKPK